MPEGPLGAPRLTNLGPLSRATKEEVRSRWRGCPENEKERQMCIEIKVAAISILENQGVLAKCDTLEDINNGRCFDISGRVSEQLDYVTVLETFGRDHSWIEYSGKHYDAEVPTGVNDPFDLPFFQRIPPRKVLDFAQMHAKAEGEEPPETVDDLIEVVENS